MISTGEYPVPGVSSKELCFRLNEETKRRFALLPEQDQARLKREAAARRLYSRTLPAPIDRLEFPDVVGLCPDGPLGLSSRDGNFPMRPQVVQERLDVQGFADRAHIWEKEHAGRVEADPEFPDSVPEARHCIGACKGGVDDEKNMAAAELVSYLRRVLRFCCTRAKGDGGDPTTVVKFRSPAHTVY